MDAGHVDAAARDYIEAISPEQRPLFERIHGLVLGQYPHADVMLSYEMPTYKVGHNSLHVAVWKHGLSFYGWKDPAESFTSRHPQLVGDKGTIKLRPEDAARISDEELRDLVRASLEDGVA